MVAGFVQKKNQMKAQEPACEFVKLVLKRLGRTRYLGLATSSCKFLEIWKEGARENKACGGETSVVCNVIDFFLQSSHFLFGN